MLRAAPLLGLCGCAAWSPVSHVPPLLPASGQSSRAACAYMGSFDDLMAKTKKSAEKAAEAPAPKQQQQESTSLASQMFGSIADGLKGLGIGGDDEEAEVESESTASSGSS